MTVRKGYVRRSDIPRDVLAALNRGEIESRTLAEGLAIDFRLLMACVVPEIPDQHHERVDSSIGILKRTMNAGELLAELVDAKTLKRLVSHPSDTVRGWAAFAIGRLPRLTATQRLERLRPLADDSHFGVREWAWMAYRPTIALNVPGAIRLLKPWTKEDAPNLRRFASEGTRPRGVWCAHLEVLKEQPELGLPLLDTLKSDPTKYVQDSVANWLNDAGKSRPEWVRDVCRQWLRKNPSVATKRICQRAQRSLS
jgi:3-methyladenine DNA glycosylase AlkC